MILSKISFDSYEEIKAQSNSSKLNDVDYLKLNEIYSEITGRPISKGCVNCVSQACLIVNNWSDRFYNATAEKYAKILPVERVKRGRKPRINNNSKNGEK